MMRHLVLRVHLHDDAGGTARYHGVREGAPEWPPAPARVFQALVAGAARGSSLPDAAAQALRWFETLPPPIIGTPHRSLGQSTSLFVPNNDADSLSVPTDVSSIRTLKKVQPSLLRGGAPIVFAWSFEPGQDRADEIRALADEVYQFGRGTDMAWATAQITDAEGVGEILGHCDAIFHPQKGNAMPKLEHAAAGSLDSLLVRHAASSFMSQGAGPRARLLYANRPKPRFAPVSYGSTKVEFTYELRDRVGDKPWPWALGQAASLVEALRDLAAARLQAGLPSAGQAIERSLVGRSAQGTGAVPPEQRVTINPMPSIGSEHADLAIRRVLVQVPSSSPLRPQDIDWAFSGLERIDADTGELSPWLLTPSTDQRMLRHYRRSSRHWRTVTAAALPAGASRRRIDPDRQHNEAKGAGERIAEEARALTAVRVALRHAGVQAQLLSAHVQREPLSLKGIRAETFATGTRFEKERLWHVEIEFDRAIEGPLTLGDGRFLGLGLMEPVSARQQDGMVQSVWIWNTQALEEAPSPEAITMARALRRAVMSRVRDEQGFRADQGLDVYFSGHESDASRGASEGSQHLSFQWDAGRQRLMILAPHVLHRRALATGEARHGRTLESAVGGMLVLRAGAAGRFALDRAAVTTDDPILKASRQWVSVTPYVVTRHGRHASAQEALVADVLRECLRRRLPRPQVRVLAARGISGSGLQGELRLQFDTAVSGPIALGRTAYLGGGLFESS